MPLVCQLKNKSSFDASRGILKDSKGKMTLKFEQLGLGNWVNQVQFTAWLKNWTGTWFTQSVFQPSNWNSDSFSVSRPFGVLQKSSANFTPDSILRLVTYKEV